MRRDLGAVFWVIVRNRWSRVAGVVALVAAMGTAAAAFQIDAQRLTEVSASVTGLWVPAPLTGEIVRVDAASGGITARATVGESGSELIIAERDNGVIVVDRTAGRISLVDPAVHEVVRSVGTPPTREALVDIGPLNIVTATQSQVSIVDLDVTEATTVDVDAPVRSVAAGGTSAGAVVENGEMRIRVAGDGSVDPGQASTGQMVRVGDDMVVVTPDGVTDPDGSSIACFRTTIASPDHVVGAAEEWVVVVAGRTVDVANISDGRCSAFSLPDDTGVLGRPVVAEGRVYVPERESGVVHIIDPVRGTTSPHAVLPPGDLRLRSRGKFVAAYDAGASFAALLDGGGVTRFVDTSLDERGITAVLGDGGNAAIVGGDGDDGDDGVAGAGGDGGRGGDDSSPVIDAAVLTTTELNPEPEAGELVPDDELRANFSFSATSVVVGEPVRLVDSSTGNPDEWFWDFGDGTGAEGPEVQKAWDQPGTYSVTLRVSRGDETAEVALAFTVVPAEVPLPPAADFAFSATVVEVGMPVSFEDRSDGEIDRWRWDFGDGTSASAPNVTKSWASPGRYAVQLTVANDQGFDSAQVFIEVVVGLRAPVAVIDVSTTEVDLGAPLTFVGSSSTDPARFSWDFGDGRFSRGSEVVHVFLEVGTFTVTLTADNDAGRSTAQVEITVSPPTQPPIAAIGTLPAVIEVGDLVALSSISTNGPDTEEWSFGDGASASGAEVTHTWTAPGSYLLSLTATNSAGTDTVTTTIEVLSELPAPVAQIGDFNASPWVGQATVFIDASIDASSWLWDFGDGATSNAPNPLHTFTSAGAKTVTLTVSNRNGSDSASVVVEPRLQPEASFTVSSAAIRAGDSVTFTDASVNASTWLWSFGDGTTSSVQNPTHTFADTGSYDVSLTIESATGDVDSFGPVVITVDPAAPQLSGILKVPATPATITTLTTVAFSAVEASSSGPIDQFEIDFGDGARGQGAAPTFSHTYGAAGSYDVRMRARGPLGDWSPWVARTFTVVDPAPPAVAIAGSVPATAQIGTVTLSGVQLPGSGPIATWRWEVRRGAEVWPYTGQVVNHSFTAAGVYQITLIAESPVPAVPDDRVSRSITITVPPPPDILSLTANPIVPTASVVVAFTPVVTGSVATWEWDYEGGGTSYVTGTSVGQHIFNTAGNKRVYLRVTGPFGGQDVRFVDLTVNPPPAPSTPVAVPAGTVTTGTTVGFTSSNTNGRTGLTWNWTVANGSSTFTYPNAGPSISHLFATAGSWTVTVEATDSLGVTGIASSFVTVQDPLPPLVAGFTWTVTATPLQVQFTDTSTGPPISSWSWTFVGPGAVGPATVPDPLVTFPVAGLYTVELTVTSGAAVDSFSAQVTVP